MRLLLVESNPAEAILIREGLTQTGVQHELFVVADGVDGLAFLRQQGEFADTQRPDLILLTLNLPRKDGREVIREIRSDSLLPPIPVIVLTTSGSDQDVIEAYRLGANCYLVKPPDLDASFALVQKIVDFWCLTAELPANR